MRILRVAVSRKGMIFLRTKFAYSCYNRRMEISEDLRNHFRELADKYENADFVIGDPSCVLKRYKNQVDTEAAAFIAAMLAFGRRDQFLQKIERILSMADKSGGICTWLKSGAYKNDFVPDETSSARLSSDAYEKKFYRFYSYADFIKLFDMLAAVLTSSSTMSEYFERIYKDVLAKSGKEYLLLAPIISSAFEGCAVVPHGKDTANKRINMFLRWMVRRNSPVDLGFWTWYEPSNLVIPLDTHVVQEAVRFGLIPPKSGGNLKTALALTEALKQIWQDDPCKGDFALFGLGVDTERQDY